MHVSKKIVYETWNGFFLSPSNVEIFSYTLDIQIINTSSERVLGYILWVQIPSHEVFGCLGILISWFKVDATF